MNTISNVGPFYIYRTSRGVICAGLAKKKFEWFGWEFGRPDPIVRMPVLWVRIGPLVIAGLEIFADGAQVWFMGLWVNI